MNTNQHDLSDDELDQFFRNAAEKQDFDFDADSWNKMSQKLDAVSFSEPSPQGASLWLKRSVPILISLLFLIGGYYFFKPSSNQSNETTEINNNNEVVLNNQKNKPKDKALIENLKKEKFEQNIIPSSSENSAEINTIDKPKNANSDNPNELNNIKETLIIKKNNIEKQKISSNTNLGISKENNIKEAIKTQKEQKLNKNNLKKSKVDSISGRSFSENTHSSDKNSTSINNAKASQKNSIRKITNSDIILNETLINQEENTINISKNDAKLNSSSSHFILKNPSLFEPKGVFFKTKIELPLIAFESPKNIPVSKPIAQNTVFKKGLYFRLALSPDLSLVTMDKMTKSGSNWAALLEYRFNNRLSIQSGIIRSMKYYNSSPSAYEWPASWSQPPALVNINAACRMLDIPLNVRYDVTQKNNSRIFLSTGSTSYISLNEKYTYNYENPADPMIKWKTWQGKTKPSYFGMLNFSLGYEHQVFRKMSFQVEPFIKMPVSKFGFGKVHLSSGGVFLSLKHSL